MLGFAALAEVALAEIPGATTGPTPPSPGPPPFLLTDYIDYIFKFPDRGSFLRDPFIEAFLPSVTNSQPGCELLVYNPVETLYLPVPTIGNVLVSPPQLANSSVPLSGFWAMLTLQGATAYNAFATHPNIQIISNRTLMFAQQPSVIQTAIDVSHINIVINVSGVYVRDGLQMQPLALTDDTGTILLTDDSGTLVLTAG